MTNLRLSLMKTLAALALMPLAAMAQTSQRPAVSIDQGGFKTFWEARLPLTAGETVKQGYLRDDAVYVATSGGTMFALHAETGLLRWGEILTDEAYTVFPPSHIHDADGRGPVVIATTNQVYIKDRYSGKDMVRFRADFPIGTGAVGFPGALLMGSSNGRLYSLAWDPLRPAEPFKRWEVDSGGPISAEPILYPPRSLLIASQSGDVFSCMADNKVLIWRFRAGGPIFGDPFIDEQGAYIPSMDRSLYKLQPHQGGILWRARFPDPLRTGPVVVDETVYQFTPSQGITALDANTGSEKWSQRGATQFLAQSKSGAVLLSGSDRLLLVDPNSGSVNATVSIPPVVGGLENTRSDSVFLLGSAGRVTCLRPDKVPYLREQQVEMAKESLNNPPPVAGPAEPQPRPRPVPPREDPFRSRHDRP